MSDGFLNEEPLEASVITANLMPCGVYRLNSFVLSSHTVKRPSLSTATPVGAFKWSFISYLYEPSLSNTAILDFPLSAI